MRLRSDQLLFAVATLLVAGVFAFAGAGKVFWPDTGPSMVERYLPSHQSIRAVGLIEMGLALWLISCATPRWAAAFAALSLAVFTALIAVELTRIQPLPCGCLPTTPDVMDPFAVRKGLWISISRNVFLLLMCGLSAALAPLPKTDRPRPPAASAPPAKVK